jgi:hypothetical protein
MQFFLSWLMDGREEFLLCLTMYAPNDPNRSSCVRSGMARSTQTRHSKIGIGNDNYQFDRGRS